MAARSYGNGTVYQRADGLWIGKFSAGWTPRGTRRYVTVSAKTKTEATKRLRDKRRGYLDNPSSVDGGRLTVKAWAGVWLDEHGRRVRPKTFATDAGAIRKWVVPTIGHRRLADLTPADMRAVEKAVRDAGRTSTAARHAVTTARRMFKAATIEGHAVPPRIFAIKPPAHATHDRDAIPLVDAIAILKAARATTGGSRWVAAFLQGLRQAEALGLTWDRVDLDESTIDIAWQLQPLPYLNRAARTFRIPDGYEVRHLSRAYHLVRPKTSRGYRVVPLVPWLAAELRAWRDLAPVNPWGLVWPQIDARTTPSLVVPTDSARDREAWRDMQDVAQVAKLNGTIGRRYDVHEIRHTTATLLLEAGIDDPTVQAIMGHSSISTTRGYQNARLELRRRAMADVAHRLGITG